MSVLIELITNWESYQSKYPNATAVDFCQYFIEQDAKKIPKASQMKSSEELNTTISELIGKLANFHTVYAKMMLKELPDVEMEWFYILNVINIKKTAKKSEIISLCLLEQSTGIDILNRMKKKGLVIENSDPNDKRAKLIRITKSGSDLLLEIGRNLYKVTYLVYEMITGADKQEMINILNNIVSNHGAILAANRNKKIDVIIRDMYGDEGTKEVSRSFNDYLQRHQKIQAESNLDNKQIRSYHK